MRIIFILFFTLTLSSCKKNYESLIAQTWVPVQVENYQGQTNIGSGLLQFALTFSDSSELISSILGTDYNKISKYKLIDSKLELSDDESSGIVKILSLRKNELKLQIDSFHIVTYIPFPIQNTENFNKQLEDILSNNCWYLINSSFSENLLIEFKDSLEDKIIKHHLRDELNAAEIHIFENGYSDFYLDMVWGTSYFNNSNILSISEVDGPPMNNIVFITSVSDSLILGFNFVNKKKSVIKLIKAKSDVKNIIKQISKEWVLTEFEEVDGDNNEYRSSFGGVEKALKLSDLKGRILTMSLEVDNLFSIKVDNEILTHGTWRLSESGKLIELTSIYKKDDFNYIRDHFLTIIELDSTHLKIFRREKIESSECKIARLKFIETYKPTGGNIL